MLNLYTLPKKRWQRLLIIRQVPGVRCEMSVAGTCNHGIGVFLPLDQGICKSSLSICETVEQLQHFDSKAYCFVMCGLGFPVIWLTIGRLLEITADTWKTTWTRMSWALHGRLVHMRTGSHDTWHRNGCSTTIVMYCKLYMCFFLNICLCALTYCEDRL